MTKELPIWKKKKNPWLQNEKRCPYRYYPGSVGFFLDENMNTVMDTLHETWSHEPTRLLFCGPQNSELCFCVRGKKNGKVNSFFFFFQMPASYRSSSFILLPTMCTEPKYFLFGTPGHWLNKKQYREGREECSILFHVIKIAAIYLHIPAPLELPIYLSVLSLSSLEALWWKGTIKPCALQVDSVPHVVLQKYLKF